MNGRALRTTDAFSPPVRTAGCDPIPSGSKFCCIINRVVGVLAALVSAHAVTSPLLAFVTFLVGSSQSTSPAVRGPDGEASPESGSGASASAPSAGGPASGLVVVVPSGAL